MALIPTVEGIRLAWNNRNDFQEYVNIYRSESPFDKDSLPLRYDQISGDSTTYIDENITVGNTYYYIISVEYNNKEQFQMEYSIEAKQDAGPQQIGEYYQGGYYVGNVVIQDGEEDDGMYALIMAGIEFHQTLQWKIEDTVEFTDLSYYNGLKNCLRIQDYDDIEKYPAIEYCLNFKNDGYDDWYLPQLEEFNIAYQNRSVLTEVFGQNPGRYWQSSTASAQSTAVNGMYYPTGTSTIISKTSYSETRPFRRVPIVYEDDGT